MKLVFSVMDDNGNNLLDPQQVMLSVPEMNKPEITAIAEVWKNRNKGGVLMSDLSALKDYIDAISPVVQVCDAAGVIAARMATDTVLNALGIPCKSDVMGS